MPALTGRILQSNVNHSACARGSLIQSLAEWNMGLAIVAEPYRVPARPDWIGDTSHRFVVIRGGTVDGPALLPLKRGNGYVAVDWGDALVVPVYAPPNAPLSELDDTLSEIRNAVVILSANRRQVLVLDDYNSKSTAWGCQRTDRRGELIEECSAELDLQLLNAGRVSTCAR